MPSTGLVEGIAEPGADAVRELTAAAPGPE